MWRSSHSIKSSRSHMRHFARQMHVCCKYRTMLSTNPTMRRLQRIWRRQWELERMPRWHIWRHWRAVEMLSGQAQAVLCFYYQPDLQAGLFQDEKYLIQIMAEWWGVARKFWLRPFTFRNWWYKCCDSHQSICWVPPTSDTCQPYLNVFWTMHKIQPFTPVCTIFPLQKQY